MAQYPIKMLKDESGTPFVPLVAPDAVQDGQGFNLLTSLDNKLEKTNIIAGQNITISASGNDLTISSTASGPSGNVIDNLNQSIAGVGVLDAHQGYVLKEMIPDVQNNVTSTSTTDALSAYQGYLLSHKIVPTGGTTGQVLKKKTNSDNDVEWGDAADPNAISGDGSIKKIVEITYADYKDLENDGDVDPDTEYHILDSQSDTDHLQDVLDGINDRITEVDDKLISYSTNEQVTGLTWIDGKPIYQRTFFGSLTLGSITEIADVSSLNYDHVSFYDVTFTKTKSSSGSGKFWFPVFYDSSSDYARVYLRDRDKKLLGLIKGDPVTEVMVYVTLRYTKTTDTAVPYFALRIVNRSTSAAVTKLYRMSSATMTFADWLVSPDNVDGFYVKSSYGPGYYVALPNNVAPENTDRYYINTTDKLTEAEVLALTISSGSTYQTAFDREIE